MQQVIESLKGKKVKVFTKTGYIITDAILEEYTNGILTLKADSAEHIDVLKPGTSTEHRMRILHVEMTNVDLIGE